MTGFGHRITAKLLTKKTGCLEIEFKITNIKTKGFGNRIQDRSLPKRQEVLEIGLQLKHQNKGMEVVTNFGKVNAKVTHLCATESMSQNTNNKHK